MTSSPNHPVNLGTAIQRWSDPQIQCRTYGHSWRPRSVAHYRGFYRVFQWCNRGCGTSRHMDMSETGAVLTRWQLRYGEGYLLVGLGRVLGSARDQLRLASIRGVTITEVREDE